jgi:hypothetical protein
VTYLLPIAVPEALRSTAGRGSVHSELLYNHDRTDDRTYGAVFSCRSL